MIVYRLSRAQYKNDLSGKGAQLAGGRWNSPGIPVLYTTESRALAALEIAVHVPLNVVPDDYFIITIEIPESVKIITLGDDDLPPGWNTFPGMGFTQTIGDNFFRLGQNMVLRAPSAVVEGDYNILLNPLHKDFIKVKVVNTLKFEFDQRLFLKNPA